MNALVNLLSSSEILIRPGAPADSPVVPKATNSASPNPHLAIDKTTLANLIAASSKPEDAEKKKKDGLVVMHIIHSLDYTSDQWSYFPESRQYHSVTEVQYSERAFPKDKSVSALELMKVMGSMGLYGRQALGKYMKLQSQKQGKELGIGALHVEIHKEENRYNPSRPTETLRTIFVVFVEEEK